MKKSIVFVMVFLGCLVVMTGCRKDDMAGGIMLTTESFVQDGMKTSVVGDEVHWVDGDAVRINGQTGTVEVSGSTARAVGIESLSGAIRGYYPASIITATGAANENTDSPTIVFPHRYASSFSGSSQIIGLPMVGRASEGATAILFKHLSAAVNVRVKNSTGREKLYLDSVIVISADKQLCGTATVTLSSSDDPVVSGASNVEANRSVVVYFDEPVLISGDYLQVQVPILPVAGGELTFKVYTHALMSDIYPGVAKAHYSYNYSRALSNNALGRNVMGTVQIAVTGASDYVTEVNRGLFTINNSYSKVRFSQGNLQYQASSGTWRFAEHQYDFIGIAAGNSTAVGDRATQSGWIDWFAWGTSGYNNKYPYMISGTPTDFGDGNNPIAGTNYDWGVYNYISNGGAEKVWRTMTKDEWNTLTSRTTSLGAGVTMGYATIAGKKGIILIPDYFVDPMKNGGSGAFKSSKTYSGYNQNVYDLSGWAIMEAGGAVFLPAAGRNNVAYSTGAYDCQNANVQGYYWTSTNGSTNYAITCNFKTTSFEITGNWGIYRQVCNSVRLVQDF